MNQRTHTWLAIRALSLLEDVGVAPDLVSILKPRLKDSAIGSWIPDLADSKIAGGDIDYHTFKLEEFNGNHNKRFIVKKDELLENLQSTRLMHKFIDADEKNNLSKDWWGASYKADPAPGEHIPNRSDSLAVAISDLLIFGDPHVAALVPGTVRFAHKLHNNARSRREEAALYFFMLSHFIADGCQPCHCDARPMTSYSNGFLHKQLEAHWSKKVGTFFDKKKLYENKPSSAALIEEAKEVDKKFGIEFSDNPDSILKIKARDMWEEMVQVCRGSFALSCMMVPVDEIPLDSSKKITFAEVFGDSKSKKIKEFDRVIMHDSVLNIAIAWNYIWQRFN